MKLGQTFKRQGEVYTVYKINDKGCFAEDEYKTTILCVPNLKRIK